MLLLDGPQGWKSPQTGIPDIRICERVLNTPGKTGEIGEDKPITYLNFIYFSFNLIHIMRVDYGWHLLKKNWLKKSNRFWLVEVFLTSIH